MKYDTHVLPENVTVAASTPMMNEKTVLQPILHSHMAPKGKIGYLIVNSGSLQFQWEDTGEILDAAPGHPVVIFPERKHHVILRGPVEFKVTFYNGNFPEKFDPDAIRPGEQFLHK